MVFGHGISNFTTVYSLQFIGLVVACSLYVAQVMCGVRVWEVSNVNVSGHLTKAQACCLLQVNWL